MSENLLEIKDLHVNAGEKEILKGLNLNIKKGEIHVIMGPNGAGKSTLANVILNNPEYTKTSGTVEFEGENINNLSTDQIAKKGIFMSFQLPEEIPGISTMNFLKYAKNKITEKPVKIFEFKDTVKKYVEELKSIINNKIIYLHDLKKIQNYLSRDKKYVFSLMSSKNLDDIKRIIEKYFLKLD